MTSTPTVAVTGAGGFVARHLRRLLHNEHIPTVAVARSDFEALPGEVKVVTARYSDADMPPELGSCSCMAHLVGSGRGTAPSDYMKVNAGMARRAIRLCEKAGIGRIVYCSGLGVGRAVRSSGGSRYFASKMRAELEIVESGLDYAILRPSYIVGDGDPLTANLRRQMRGGVVTVPGPGATIQPISVADAARTILLALTDERFSRRTLDLVGPHAIPFDEFVLRLVKGAARIEKVSFGLARRLAARDSRFPYSLEELDILEGGFEGSFEEIRQLAGFDFAVP